MVAESVKAIFGGRERHARRRSEQIDLQLEQWGRRDRSGNLGDLGVLVLGPSRSGKSTLIKHMEISHGGISDADRERYKPVILGGIVESMRILITTDYALLDYDDIRPHVQTILDLPKRAHLDMISPDIRAAVEALWGDERVQHSFGQYRQENGIAYTSMEYFFDNLARLASPDYSPSDQDILHTHVKTPGIRRATLDLGPNLLLRVSEVGTHGRGDGLHKCFHYFEDTRAVIIMAPLSAYFEPEAGGPSSRLDEARNAFVSLSELKWFEGEEKCIILLFNEVDKFREMLPRHPLADFFPDYEGGEGYKEACQFIAGTFTQRTERRVYVHYCSAIDMTQMKMISAAVVGKVPDHISHTIPKFRVT